MALLNHLEADHLENRMNGEPQEAEPEAPTETKECKIYCSLSYSIFYSEVMTGLLGTKWKAGRESE